MQIPGIIGGIGPESTVDYYRSIIDLYRQRTGGRDYPPILIRSIDMTAMLDIVAAGDFPALTDMLLSALRSLASAGAHFALMASNTPHIVFDDLAAVSPLPLLSIVEAACREVEHTGLRRLGLLGTAFTMERDFYAGIFARRGISIEVPGSAARSFIHEKIFDELEFGIVRDETRKAFLDIIAELKKEKDIQGIVLGCTELPLLLKNGDDRLPFFNTTEIHVRAVVDRMLE